jgi:DNA-binding NtrC family response regulator
MRLSDAATQVLLEYSWPGNVRELERLIERVVALAQGDVIEIDDLPPGIRGDYGEILMPSFRRHETLRVWACRYARLVLDRCKGNKREAARVLGISSHTLTTYLRSWADAGMDGDRAGPAAKAPEPVEATVEVEG